MRIDMFREKAEDPTELAEKIGKIKEELEIINNKMYKGVDEVVSRYVGEDSKVNKKAAEATEEFKNNISEIDPDDSNSFDDLMRQVIHKIDDYKSLQEELQKNVIAECNEALIALSDEGSIPYSSLEPDFTEATFKNIKDSTKEKAEETRSYEEGITFKKTHTYSQYSRNKHFRILNDSVINRLEKIKNDIIDNLGAFVRNIRSQYLSELLDHNICPN